MSRRKLRTRADGERVTFRTFAEPGLFLLPVSYTHLTLPTILLV